MNQVERIVAVTIARRELAHDQDTIKKLKAACHAASQVLKYKNPTPKELADANNALEKLNPLITDIEARCSRNKAYIKELDHAAVGDATVQTISGTSTYAEIVITYERDDGKKISYTRHVRRVSGGWVGRSILTNDLVNYRLPGSAVQADAA